MWNKQKPKDGLEMYNTKQTQKKLKPGLVASRDIRPGNGEGLFLVWHLIDLSLTYLLRHLTYLLPRDPHRAPKSLTRNNKMSLKQKLMNNSIRQSQSC